MRTNEMTDKQPYLCIDVIQLILDFADIITQLNLTNLSKECHDRLKIRQLTDKRITQDIIQQKKSKPVCDDSLRSAHFVRVSDSIKMKLIYI